MNTSVSRDDSPRYEKLAKPAERSDKSSVLYSPKGKRGALSYDISEKLNKLTQPKRREDTNTMVSKSANSAEKSGQRKLINSNQLRDEPHKKKHLLDTYAGITAAKNKRCSKRLLELARPKTDFSVLKGEPVQDYNEYLRMIKKYDSASTSSRAIQKKRR